MDDETNPTRPLRFRERFAIRMRHRRLTNPEEWRMQVSFDSLIAANEWDLASNFDELNDRYAP